MKYLTLILLLSISSLVFAQDSSTKDSSSSVSTIQNTAAAENQTNESEKSIALNLEKDKKLNVAGSDSPFKTIAMVLVMILMGVGSFYWIKKNAIQQKSSHTQIKVLSQFYLGPKKSLAIVRVAGESILIGVTDQNINMIKSLSLLDEDIPEESPKDFKEELVKKTTQETEEEFSMGGLSDVVHQKMKSMRMI
ncbi:MAG TPA: flagellar biosynthetic protein FliO [Pseudobdellovibrionaceae bacterium]|nr:flagellar biosynthetic protein FliO [Pseudobdellovibrionaceae bacterium]